MSDPANRRTSCPPGRDRAEWLAANLAGMRTALKHKWDVRDIPPSGLAGPELERWLERRIQLVLERATGGAPVRYCRGCGRNVWWLAMPSGKRAPYTTEGLSHFVDCPQAQQFRVQQQAARDASEHQRRQGGR
jgi:hypothetical protein